MALPVHERERSTKKYSEVGAARRRRRASSSLESPSDGHPAGSLRPTETTGDGTKLRRGAATDLMGEVGDAFVAPRAVPVAGGGSQCGHHAGFGEDDSPPPSRACCPEHPAVYLATAFYCAPRIASLRSERTQMPWQEKQLGAREFARRGNCALGTQPPNPRAPPNTAPHTSHLTSDGPAWWSWVLPRAQPPARRSAMPRRRQREPKDARDKVKLAVASTDF